jgi:multidrug efflux pump subunit AcrA (membrane-fusion protein)
VVTTELARDPSTGASAPADIAGGGWRELAQAQDCASAAEPWLTLSCGWISAVRLATVLLPGTDSVFRPVACWPSDKAPSRGLLELAELALKEGRGSIRDCETCTRLAYPLSSGGQVFSVAVIEIATTDRDSVREAMLRLRWAGAYLVEVYQRQQLAALEREDTGARLALDTIAAVLDTDGSRAGAYALVQRLVADFSLERACIGFLKQGRIELTTISHSASFGRQMELVRLLSAAMEEALEQRVILAFPQEDREVPRITQAHEALSLAHKTGPLLTVPLLHRGEAVGALICEWGRSARMDDRDAELITGTAAYLGPILYARRDNERSVIRRMGDAGAQQLRRLAGAGYPGRKLAAMAALGALVFMALAKGDYQVTADGGIEGEVQRAIVAPFDGYILRSAVSAGDEVEAGLEMAALDDRELALDRLNWVSKKQEYVFEYNRALDSRNRAEVSIYKARIAQADVQLEMLDQQLQRAKLVAPFAGYVVAGDLSQAVGSSVRRGEVLFEVAPLDAYRLNLLVDESQLGHVEVGQSGQFLTSSLPSTPFEFVVTKLTPIAQALDGRTVFTVEAVIPEQVALLRPGMKGVAKIQAGERSLMWIWTRELSHWLRLWLWRF